MKKINLLLLKVNFLFVCLTLEVYYYRKELDTILKYLIEKKRPSLWRERNKGIKNKTVAVRDDGGYEPIINVTLLGK